MRYTYHTINQQDKYNLPLMRSVELVINEKTNNSNNTYDYLHYCSICKDIHQIMNSNNMIIVKDMNVSEQIVFCC